MTLWWDDSSSPRKCFILQVWQYNFSTTSNVGILSTQHVAWHGFFRNCTTPCKKPPPRLSSIFVAQNPLVLALNSRHSNVHHSKSASPAMLGTDSKPRHAPHQTAPPQKKNSCFRILKKMIQSFSLDKVFRSLWVYRFCSNLCRFFGKTHHSQNMHMKWVCIFLWKNL